MKGSASMMKAKMIAMVLIMMFLMMLSACSETSTQHDADATATPTENLTGELVETQETEPDEWMDMEPEDIYENGLCVQTSVGEFKLPEEWNEKVFAEEVPEENCNRVTWYTMVSEQRVDLFSVYIGTSDVGYYFGNAKDVDGNKVGIYVEVIEQETDMMLTEEQIAELDTMREGVNFVIEQIYALPDFEKMG